MEVVVVVKLGVDTNNNLAAVAQKSVKELFKGKNLSAYVTNDENSILVVNEIVQKTEDGKGDVVKTLAEFRHWVYYRITE